MPKPAAARTAWVLKLYKRQFAPVIIIVLLAAGLTIGLLVGGQDSKKKTPQASASQGCGNYRQDGIVTINNSKIKVEIAYSSAEKAKGLGGRPCIASNQGMLFDFGKDGQYAMWMKDMKFPIDIIWINSNHQIAGLWRDVEPATYHSKYPLFENDPQHPARYVLELKANESKALGLDLGTPVYFQKT